MLKNLLFAFLCLCAFASLDAQAAKTEYVYLSSGDNVTVFTLDESSGELTQIQEVSLTRSGVMAFTQDLKNVYIASRAGKNTAIGSFQIGADGKLKKLHTAEGGRFPSYLSLDATDQYLYGSNYREGSVTIWSLDGRVVKNAKGSEIRYVELEQKAHATIFAPDHKHLFVPATGPNKVFQLIVNEKDGGLIANSKASAAGPGTGGAMQPRHIRFHPTLDVAYTTLERELPGVGVWDWDRSKGQVTFRNEQVSLPKGFNGRITTAELHLSPDAEYLYISNRDGTKGAKKFFDSIVIYKVDGKTGNLSFVSHFSCGRVPRAFWLSSTGKYMFIAGQGDNTLSVVKRDSKTGLLTHLKTIQTGARPVWVQPIVK